MRKSNDWGGIVLDVNTDCAVCTFPYNKLPFEVDENNVVQGYYYDLEETAPKYRMAEEGTMRFVIPNRATTSL